MERLKELRIKNELRQSDMAAIANVSTQTYAGYENGKTQPTADALIKLSLHFDVSIDWLCGQRDSSARWADTYADVLEIIQRLFSSRVIMPSTHNVDRKKGGPYLIECNPCLSSILQKLDDSSTQLHEKAISEYEFFATWSLIMETASAIKLFPNHESEDT